MKEYQEISRKIKKYQGYILGEVNTKKYQIMSRIYQEGSKYQEYIRRKQVSKNIKDILGGGKYQEISRIYSRGHKNSPIYI